MATGAGAPAGDQRTSSDSDIRRVRIDTAEPVRRLGRAPYAYSSARPATAAELLRRHEALPAGEEAEPGAQERVAGRIRLRRVLGRLAFAQLQDPSGVIQLYFDKRVLGDEAFQNLKQLLDIGDVIGAEGERERERGVGGRVWEPGRVPGGARVFFYVQPNCQFPEYTRTNPTTASPDWRRAHQAHGKGGAERRGQRVDHADQVAAPAA